MVAADGMGSWMVAAAAIVCKLLPPCPAGRVVSVQPAEGAAVLALPQPCSCEVLARGGDTPSLPSCAYPLETSTPGDMRTSPLTTPVLDYKLFGEGLSGYGIVSSTVEPPVGWLLGTTAIQCFFF